MIVPTSILKMASSSENVSVGFPSGTVSPTEEH